MAHEDCSAYTNLQMNALRAWSEMRLLFAVSHQFQESLREMLKELIGFRMA